jgi:hypothetical protein
VTASRPIGYCVPANNEVSRRVQATKKGGNDPRLSSRPIRTSAASAGGAAPPNFLRARSVDQVGRKSETTLGIASLHFEIGTFPGAAPDQFELPPRAPNAGHRQWGCGEHGDAPAGDGCRRLAEISRFRRPPPAADGEANGAGAFGSKLKAAGGKCRNYFAAAGYGFT